LKMTEQEKYPAIETREAFEITSQTYGWMLQRYEAMQVSLDKIVGWCSGLIAAFLAFGFKEYDINMFFYLGSALFLIALGLCFYAKNYGDITLYNPVGMWDKSLEKDIWTFKKDVLYASVDAYKKNSSVIRLKWQFQFWSLVVFVLEAVCLTLWVLTAAHSSFPKCPAPQAALAEHIKCMFS